MISKERFTFISNQYYLVVGSRDVYIDFLLFHRRLRSLVAIELKIGGFKAEYASKMQLYLTALNEQVKLPEGMRRMLPEPEKIVRRLRIFEK